MIQLLVINDRNVQAGIQSIDGYEFEVTVADSPLQAFNSIIHISPDAIALNMTNPGMDGEQVLMRIRNMQASKYVPVLLFISPEDENDYRHRLESDKLTDYFVVPVGNGEVLGWAAKATGAASAEQRKTVLVVDDDPVVLDLMKLYLGAKYKVLAMNSAADALAKLKLVTPDIILLDIAMPDMDGKELFRQIRAIESCAEIPILFQTGMAGINTVRECVKLGAAGFVIKPIQKPVLLERIEETLYPPEKDSNTNHKVFVCEEFDFLYTLIHGYLKDDYEVRRGEAVMQTINEIDEFLPGYMIIDFDNSAYILSRIREKTEQFKIPVILLSRDPMSSAVLAELNKPNTYLTQLPMTKESLLETMKNVKEWREPV
ncbi:MAG: response regulator [Lachnospiraceae bacterium]|nr:response regulator [Lachnospiraceae bacterium]MBR5731950.1 response regulator [Lachnospiraceae bacterium]